MAVLSYLAKLKRGLSLAFGVHFLHDFFVKMFLIQFSINGQSFNVTPFFFLIISNKIYIYIYIKNIKIRRRKTLHTRTLTKINKIKSVLK